MRALASLLLVITTSALAQTPDQAMTTLKIGTNLVYVPTQVQTRKGDILYALKPEQFVVEDNGIQQKIRVDEDTDSSGLALIVVVQCSGAAYAEFDRMRGLPEMVESITGGAPHQVALVSYGNEPELITGLTSSDKRLADAFGHLEPCDDNNAATLDAVNYAIHQFDDARRPAKPGYRRAILLISETHDHGSRIKPAQVIANLGRTNTVVDSVSFEPGKESILDSLLHGQMGPGPLGLIVMAVQALKRNVPESLAELSGGEYSTFASAKKFDRGINNLANHIHNFYMISFQPTGTDAPGLHRISVKIPDYPDAKIRSRLTYYQGDAPPPEIPDKK
jgi:VWFA-related protein